MSTKVTWSGASSVSAAAAVDSDPISLTGSGGFSVIVEVTGSGSYGISGNLGLFVSNGGPYVQLPGSALYAVRLGAGQSEVFAWSSETFYASTILRWTQAGMPDSGELGDGYWNLSPLPAPAPAPATPPNAQVLGPAGSTDYGTDVLCVDDLDPSFSLITGRQVLAQDLYHGWTTQKGTLFYDASWGEDIQLLLNEGITDDLLAAWQGQLAAQAERDDRVQQADVALSFDEETETLTLVGQITPVGSGPFRMVVAVTDLSTTILQVT